jgi:Glycosyltransferase family 92
MKTFHKYCFCLILISLLIIFIFSRNFAIENYNSISSSSKCGRYPTQSDVLIDNVRWQVFQNPAGFLYLMNAYLDLRREKFVVINAIGAGLNITAAEIFCQYWFDKDSAPLVVQASRFDTLWRWRKLKKFIFIKNLKLNICFVLERFGKINFKKAPYLIWCPLPIKEKIPHSVSITLNRCDFAENNLVIIDNQPPNGVKKKFGICTKQFTFKKREHVIKFVEWTEMMRLLGADKIHTYNRFFHPDLDKITKHYENQDFMEVQPFSEPSSVSNKVLHVGDSLLLELTVVNDCFYRVRNLYEYIAILDPDEIFLPVKEKENNWHDLFKNFESFPKQDAYAIRSVTYPPGDGKVLDSIPEYYYMLQHVQVKWLKR